MRTSVTAESIPTKFCSSTSWVDIVIYLTWHRNWLRGYGGVGCENGPLPLTSALASNTAYSATAHTRESCTSGHMVTFSTAEYHWSSAGTKLCCLVTVTLCTNNFPKIIYATRKLPRVKLANLQSQVQPLCVIWLWCERLTVFKMVAVRHLGFVKFKFFNSRRG